MDPFLRENFKPHEFDWMLTTLRLAPSYIERPMFGCRACYLMGELKLVLAASGEEPWNGVLVATKREHHPSLTADFPELHNHPVLPKWLYISQECEGFEEICNKLSQLALANDARLGVPPSRRRRASRASRSAKRSRARAAGRMKRRDRK